MGVNKEGTPKPTTTEHPQPEPRQRGTGNIYQRKNKKGETLPIWWLRYSHQGKPVRESSHSTDPQIAEKLLQRRIRAVLNDKEGIQTFVPGCQKVRVGELLDSLEEHYTHKERDLAHFKSHVKQIRVFFGDMRAVAVTSDHVHKYIKLRKKEGRANATINRELQLLGQSFRLGIKNKKILTAPSIDRLPEDNVRSGFFEKWEFEAVVRELPEYLQDVMRFAYLTSWRKGQILKLRWGGPDKEGVDRVNGTITAPAATVKNRKSHKIVMVGEVAEIIERRWLARKYKAPSGDGVSEFVFHRNGERIRQPRRAWDSACEAAGFIKPKLDKKTGKPVLDKNGEVMMVPSKLIHDLRRSGIRNMVRAGTRESVAMSISGHKTRSTFERYNIVDDSDQRLAFELTDEYLKTELEKGQCRRDQEVEEENMRKTQHNRVSGLPTY